MNRQLTTGLIALLVMLLAAGGVSAQGGGPGDGPAVDRWVISGGGASSTGGGITLNDTLGQPIVGDANGTNMTLQARYWPCSAPAAVSTAAAARLNSTDVRLTWSGSAGSTGVFDVWRGTAPYFTPGAAGSVLIGDDVTSPFTATAVLGNPTVNYAFLVLAQSGCGSSGPSNRTAEFDFSLTPGTP